METILEVEGLIKYFPVIDSKAVVKAVNGVSFSVRRGETLALVGESGSGKTTVGRCLLGLEERTEGSIRFKGVELPKRRYKRPVELCSKIQIVFQEPAESLDPRMRIGSTIEEPLRALKVASRERERRVEEVVERVGLSREVIGLYPRELGAGQQQRVGIARAIITKPELIVLDEPTSALDPAARAEIIMLLGRLQSELETAYLFISHDLNTVHHVSSRVAIMYLGMIMEQGVTNDIFAKPLHPYSIGLLASVLLPNPRLKRQTNVTLKGEIPSPINLPQGCFLGGRCPFAIRQCFESMPPPREIDRDHIVHCYKWEEASHADESFDTFKEFHKHSERLLWSLSADAK